MNSPAEIASELAHCQWIFDLFALGFDHLSQHLHITSEVMAEMELAEEEFIRSELESWIVRDDGAIPESLRIFLEIPDQPDLLAGKEFLWRLFFAVRAIDRAAGTLNHFHPGFRDPRSWRKVNQHLHMYNGYLHSGPRKVVLKPPPRFPASLSSWWAKALDHGRWVEPPARGYHLHRFFTNLCRVPDLPGCNLVFRILDETIDADAADWSSLRIGVIPLIEELDVSSGQARLLPGPLTIARGDQNRLRIESLGAAPATQILCERAEAALRFLVEQKCQIVLMPEVVVPDAVVTRLRRVLRDLYKEGTGYPALLLAGSYSRPGPNPGLPYNEAIVLSGHGDEVWRQSKLHPYQMERYEQKRYGLDAMFEDAPAVEEIQCHPRSLVFCDSPNTGMRIVVAICEDAAHDDPCLNAIRALRPNLVLNPVMAGALLPKRGFALTTAMLAQDPGCVMTVVNSAALARAEWKNDPDHPEGDPPLAIVGIPLLDSRTHYESYRLLTSTVAAPGGVEVLVYECPVR